MAKRPSFNYNNSVKNEVQAKYAKALTEEKIISGIKRDQSIANQNQPSLSTQHASSQFTPQSPPPFSSPNPLPSFGGSLHSALGAISKYNHDRIHASSYVNKMQFSGSLNGQPQQYSMNMGAPRIMGGFQASYSNINTGGSFPSLANQAASFRTSQFAGMANSPIFGTMGAGTINSQQMINAAKESAATDKLTTALNNLSKKIDDTSRGGGGGVGGGGGDDGGDGFGGFLQRLGRKDRNGFRGGMAGMVLQSGAQIAGAGIDMYLNQQLQMATAPVQTYSNIAQLKGFQQQRFLRDFSDFSPEALILRNKSLRYDQTDITSRIDKVAKETSQKQDVAETQATIKQSFSGVLKSIGGGALEGAQTGALMGMYGGPKGALLGAGVGALLGGGVALARGAADYYNNPALMRTGALGPSDIYLKERTAFDTRTIMANTQAMEDAVIRENQIDIANQRIYQQTVGNRLAGFQQGRFVDLTGNLIQQSYAKGTSRKTGLGRGGMPAALGYSIGAGEETQSEKMATEAQKAYQDTQAGTDFTSVIARMGYSTGSAEGVNVFSKFAGIGGAGGGIGSGATLERIRKMSLSGGGSYEQIIGQATLLGRVGGGVTAAENTKKFEEVMSRAVKIGMDNSELRSEFAQNVVGMAQRMGTADVEGVARLVQKMQVAGGGQLVDYQRMQKSMAGIDVTRQQNLFFKAQETGNLADAIDRMGFANNAQKARALTDIKKLSTVELESLESYAQRYAKGESLDRMPENVRNLLSGMTKEQAGAVYGKEGTSKQLMEGRAAALLGTSPEAFKKKFGRSISEFNKLPANVQAELRGRFGEMQGADRGQFEDYIKMLESKRDYGKGALVNEARVKAAETANQLNIQKAVTDNTQAAAATNEISMAAKIKASGGKLTPEQINKYGFTEADTQIAERLISEGKFRGGAAGGTKLRGREKEISDIISKTELQQQGISGISAEERAQGGVMNQQDAAMIGTEFAKAFFIQMRAERDQRASAVSNKLLNTPTKPAAGSTAGMFEVE